MNKHLEDIKRHYEERGCIIEICPICKKFTKFDFNNKVISGASLSSGMFCICPRK